MDYDKDIPDEHISRLLHLAAESYDERNLVLTVEALDAAKGPIVEILRQQSENRSKILNQIKDAQNRRSARRIRGNGTGSV